MWTLVLIVLLTHAAVDGGGASTTTSFLDFPDQARCQAAASLLEARSGAIPNSVNQSVYQISTTCVQR